MNEDNNNSSSNNPIIPPQQDQAKPVQTVETNSQNPLDSGPRPSQLQTVITKSKE